MDGREHGNHNHTGIVVFGVERHVKNARVRVENFLRCKERKDISALTWRDKYI
jgi:hypothetical protein